MSNETMLIKALLEGKKVSPTFQPQTNEQAYLAYLNGLDIDLPEPRTYKEVLLYNLCCKGGTGGGSSAEIKDCAYLFASDGSGYASNMRIAEIESIMPLVKQPTRATRMFYGWDASAAVETVDLSSPDWSKCTDFKGMFEYNKAIKRVDLSSVDMSGCNSSGAVESIFGSNNKLEEVIGVFHNLRPSTKVRLAVRGYENSVMPLKRFVIAPDAPNPMTTMTTPFTFTYCSFDREGMVEFFNSLPSPEITSGDYAKINITGNPCVTDGTLTDADRAIAINKGWILVEA